MNQQHMRELLTEQNKRSLSEHIPRTLQLTPLKNNPFIIIISGIRRSGKSQLLLTQKTHKTYYVDFDDERFIGFTHEQFHELHSTLRELFGEHNTFLFDEIQNIPGWERFVRRLHTEKKKIFITGSNANLLSKELGTHLTGRHLTKELFPFSYKEFLTKHNTTINPNDPKDIAQAKALLSTYMEQGGLPEYLNTNNQEYLKTLYENILYRDIITRHNIKEVKSIRETAHYLASNIGKEFSYNSIKKLTGLTSATTIREYIQYLQDTYLVFEINRYDASIKKQAYYNKKIYFIDTALANTVGFRTSPDNGRILENTIFLQLRRQYKEIYFYKETNHECDFLVKEKNTITQAIQVTTHLNNENTKREVQGLIQALKETKATTGIIITLDQEDKIIHEGHTITVIPAWKWLLQETHNN